MDEWQSNRHRERRSLWARCGFSIVRGRRKGDRRQRLRVPCEITPPPCRTNCGPPAAVAARRRGREAAAERPQSFQRRQSRAPRPTPAGNCIINHCRATPFQNVASLPDVKAEDIVVPIPQEERQRDGDDYERGLRIPLISATHCPTSIHTPQQWATGGAHTRLRANVGIIQLGLSY